MIAAIFSIIAVALLCYQYFATPNNYTIWLVIYGAMALSGFISEVFRFKMEDIEQEKLLHIATSSAIGTLLLIIYAQFTGLSLIPLATFGISINLPALIRAWTAGICEEIFFRFTLQIVILKNKWFAVPLSAIAFSLTHWFVVSSNYSGLALFFKLLLIFFAGVLLSSIAKFGGLSSAIIAHSIYDLWVFTDAFTLLIALV